MMSQVIHGHGKLAQHAAPLVSVPHILGNRRDIPQQFSGDHSPSITMDYSTPGHLRVQTITYWFTHVCEVTLYIKVETFAQNFL